MVAFIVAQEIEQPLGLTSPRAKMDVGNEIAR